MKTTSVAVISLLKVAPKRTMTSSSGQPVTYLVREKQVLSHPNCLCVIQMSVANAIEAQKYVENKRFIKLSTKKKADRVRLIIENSCNIGEIHMDNQKLITSKEDKENHGIGFNRVCEVVKEKNGIITRTVNHKIFTVEIVLPIES